MAVNRVTPANFLSLIKNAGIVVTDSFHATAMSLNFGRPLYSLIKDKINSDNRVLVFCNLWEPKTERYVEMNL